MQIHILSNDPYARDIVQPVNCASEFEELQAALYRLWEITTVEDEWKRDLIAYRRALFTHEGTDCLLFKLEEARYKVTFPNLITPCKK